jgi:hypothetical protein
VVSTRNLLRLTPGERALAAASLLLVPLAALLGRTLHMSRALKTTAAAARVLPIAGNSAGRAAIIVDGAGSCLRARCLTKALVLHAVLERLDLPSQVVVGAAFSGGALRSHAWVERDGKSLLGSTDGWTTIWKSST